MNNKEYLREPIRKCDYERYKDANLEETKYAILGLLELRNRCAILLNNSSINFDEPPNPQYLFKLYRAELLGKNRDYFRAAGYIDEAIERYVGKNPRSCILYNIWHTITGMGLEKEMNNFGVNQMAIFSMYLKTVDDLLAFQDGNDNKIDAQIAIYDFAIKAIAREMVVEPFTKFWLQNIPEENCPKSIWHTAIRSDRREVIDFPEIVISYPTDCEKMSGAIWDISKYGFTDNDKNTSGLYFPDVDILIITNGYHHSCVGAVQKEGRAEVQVYEFSHLLDKLQTDGENWLYTENGKTEIQSMLDYRLGLVYELFTRKSLLIQNKE